MVFIFSTLRRLASLSKTENKPAHAIKEGRPEVPDAFVIADEAGRVLDTIPLAMVCRSH